MISLLNIKVSSLCEGTQATVSSTFYAAGVLENGGILPSAKTNEFKLVVLVISKRISLDRTGFKPVNYTY